MTAFRLPSPSALVRTLGVLLVAVTAAPALAATTAPAPSAVPSEPGGIPPLVHDIGTALFLSAVLAIVFTRLKIPAIAGYILGGIVAGPLVLGLVADAANIDTIAQLGFILLLFVIGLELDFGKITASGRPIVITGIFQYPLMVAFGFIVAKLLALLGLGAVVGDNLGAFYVGLVIACSSTLLVVKLFQDAFELDTIPGRVALGLLVFEDLWAIIAILLQPSFHNPQVGPIVSTFVGIAILGSTAVLAARTLVPIAFRWIAKSPEIILVGAIAWCFAVVLFGSSFDWITEHVLGLETHINVGSGMAALIAGATIASLPYSTEIITKVNVLKDFFITLFFVALGLSVPAPDGFGVVIMSLAIAGAAIAVRQLIVFPLLYYSGLDRRNAEVTSVRMAQISEFSLVIAFLGVSLGHIGRELQTAIIFGFVITALATPQFFRAALGIHELLAPTLRRLGFRDPPELAKAEEERWRLAILGFHRVASSLVHEIARNNPQLVKQTLVIDFNVALHERIARVGVHVDYGDLSNPDTLAHAGIDRSEVVVSTLPDDLLRGTSNARIVESVRQINPEAIIIANALSPDDVEAIYEAGANYVYLTESFSAAGAEEAIRRALSGSLGEYRAEREARHGAPGERVEVLR